MNPRARAVLQIIALVAIVGALILIFPDVNAFVEKAARELLYFWWLVLLVLLAVWLIWGLGRKTRR